MLLNYCKLETVPLTVLIQFQLPAGTVVPKPGPGCLSVSDLLPGRLLALSDLLHVFEKNLQRDKDYPAHMKLPLLTMKIGIYCGLETLKPWLVQFYCFLKIRSWWRNVRGNWMQMDRFCFCSVELQMSFKFPSGSTKQLPIDCTIARKCFLDGVTSVSFPSPGAISICGAKPTQLYCTKFQRHNPAEVKAFVPCSSSLIFGPAVFSMVFLF